MKENRILVCNGLSHRRHFNGFLTLWVSHTYAFITGDFFELQCQCRQYAQNRNKQKSHLSRNFRVNWLMHIMMPLGRHAARLSGPTVYSIHVDASGLQSDASHVFGHLYVK